MILKNGTVFGKDFLPCKTDIEIEGETIKRIGKTDLPGTDCEGKNILPGFIDIHIHGCNNADVTNGEKDSVLKMSEWLSQNGITSFCPTTMTLPVDFLKNCFENVAAALGNEKGAYIHGINMEGPFVSHEKKGAQNEKYILKPDFEVFSMLNSVCPIKIVDIAPETENAEEFIKKTSKICTVSAAHTNADYACAKRAVSLGITHATHLYNAMTAFASREAGVVGAIFDSENVIAEIICDGKHVCPETLKITFKILGEDRTAVISDALTATGLEDGYYTLAGQDVIKKDGAVRLIDGTLAGSCTNLFEEFKNLLSFGIPLKQAIKSVSINPARAIGAEKETGSIEEGKRADIVILSNDFSKIESVFVKGKKVK